VLEVMGARPHDPDAAVRRQAAEDWCRWESATPDWPPTDDLDEVFADEAFALAYAQLVVPAAGHAVLGAAIVQATDRFRG
jgi:hypothetical protein